MLSNYQNLELKFEFPNNHQIEFTSHPASVSLQVIIWIKYQNIYTQKQIIFHQFLIIKINGLEQLNTHPIKY